MAEILEVDLATLEGLATELVGQADAIGKIAITKAVTMPGSPVSEVSALTGEAVQKAYGTIGGQIRTLGERARTAAGSYEDMDTANRDQLDRYGRGEGAN